MKSVMRKYIANIVTSCRIIFSILMLFFSVFSPWFYVMYLLCGLTDMVDGSIARKTNTVSTFIISGYVCNKRFTVEHTVMNKITGLLLFVLPLTLFFIERKYSAVVVCTIATFSAIQEGHYIRMGREIK